MPPFYYIAKALARFLFSVSTRHRMRGRENLPLKGPLVLVSNHLHGADIPLLMALLPRGIVFMAKRELFRPPGGWAVKGVGAIPVRRGMLEVVTLRLTMAALKQGKVLGIYPEGTRSRSGQLQTGKPGAASIAYHSQAPILPVAITGTEKLRSPFWWLHRPQVTVTLGRPFSLPPASGELSKEALAAYTSLIMEHIAELLPPEYRGVYNKGIHGVQDTKRTPPTQPIGDRIAG